MKMTSKSHLAALASSQHTLASVARKSLPAAILALSSTILLPGTALAQLEEVIVTAQGRQQSLQDVSVAVTVVSGDMLKEQGLLDLQNLSERVANVKINTGGQVNSIAVRGVGSGENAGFEQAVATFSDGVYRSRSRSTRAGLFDLDRVEVLKGPQTTFFGANASAGALNITTRKPGQEFEANVLAMYDVEFGEYNVEAGIGGPITDTFGARLAVRANGMDGFVDTPHGDGPDEDAQQARLSLNWQPNESWTSDLRFDYARSRTDIFAPFELVGCPPGAAFLPLPGNSVCGAILGTHPNIDDKLDFKSAIPRGTYQDFDFFEVAFTNVWDVGAGSIRSITAYSDMDVETRVALIPVPYNGTVGGYDAFSNESEEGYEFFSQELRFESQTGGFIEYMFGAYYSQGDLSYGNMSSFNFAPFGAVVEGAFQFDFPDFDPSTPMSGRQWMKQDEEMRSVFASVTLNPADFIRVNLGARYTEVEKEGFRRLRGGSSINSRLDTFVPFPDVVYNTPVGPITQGEAFCAVLACDTKNFARTEREDSKFMPSVGVEFDVTSDIMLYATFSRGFKAGGFSATSTPSTFGPEEVDAYEVGMKSRLLDNTLELNVAAFYMEYEGLQETTYDVNLASEITNVAGSVSQGIEVGTTWSPSPYFTLMADVGWLDATYEDYPNGECTKAEIVAAAGAPCAADLSGKRRAFAAEWSGSISALLTVPMAEHELRIMPTVNFTSNYYMTATADPVLEQAGYAKYDLRVGYGPADRQWEVAVIGRNLTDKETIGYALGMPGANGTLAAMPERGRSVALQFQREF